MLRASGGLLSMFITPHMQEGEQCCSRGCAALCPFQHQDIAEQRSKFQGEERKRTVAEKNAAPKLPDKILMNRFFVLFKIQKC